ncbi:MAG: nucleotide exchange factor GrpE [Candidatus Auribacter fodinae]|jgi:molecular chaperone GrpE|uniref:Protein GrpE n=1 Tax=Candidatus Auribacter fodinae TaxID=2093366 RepID=A0A3A4R4Q3_9BACT|nr:MAG: nucleotide exchange factor GrpE [Candidatus Auribacter fodinae]
MKKRNEDHVDDQPLEKNQPEPDAAEQAGQGEPAGKEPDTVSVSKEDYEKLQKTDEYFNQMLRIQAEFDNYRKRVNKEKIEFHKYANEKLLSEILPILDNFQRALKTLEEHVTQENHPFFQGVEMIYKQMAQLMKQYDVQELETVGKPFDPRFHEAVQQIESADHPDSTVVTEISRGYMLNDRLLRPAIVVVSKLPADAANDAN